MSGIFSIEVEGQRAHNHEQLPEAAHRPGFVVGVVACGLNPFSYDPETIGSIGCVGNVEIHERSESLKGWVKC